MDEVALHVSQKIELLQVWLGEVIQKGKDVIDVTTTEILTSEQFLFLQEGAKELAARLSESVSDAIDFLTQISYPKLIVAYISSFVENDLNRGTVAACCFGFTIGGGLGLFLGFCLQSPSKPIYMMRAVAATNFNGPDGIAFLEDIPVPQIKSPDQIIVEVRYATLCQTDLSIASGYCSVLRSILDPQKEPGVILGRSGSGTVVEVGGSVNGIDPGDKVIFWCPAWKRGCLSQYVCLNSWQVVQLPKGVSLEDGAWSAYPSVLVWKYLKDSGINTRELHSMRVFVHCGSNWIGDALRRVVASHGCEADATTSSTPVGSDTSHFFPLSTAPLLINDPERRHKYDLVFNTEGETAEEFSQCLVSGRGKVVKAYPPPLRSDTFGAFLSFTYSLWVRFTHSTKWEHDGMREGSRLVRTLGRAPPPQPPHTLDPSIVGVSPLGAVLVSMEELSRSNKKLDSVK